MPEQPPARGFCVAKETLREYVWGSDQVDETDDPVGGFLLAGPEVSGGVHLDRHVRGHAAKNGIVVWWD